MSHSGCPSAQQLIDFCIGKSPEREIDAVTNHLDSCSHCRETVEVLEKVPIPFVEYYLSGADSPQIGNSADPQFRQTLAKLKALGIVPPIEAAE